MEMIRSPLVNERVPALVAALREVGGVQIQNRGTLAGKVANASPAGDTLPVLAVMEGYCRPRQRGRRAAVPFLALYVIEIPKVEGEQWFRKVGTPRGAGDLKR